MTHEHDWSRYGYRNRVEMCVLCDALRDLESGRINLIRLADAASLDEWLANADTETIRAMLWRNDPNGSYDAFADGDPLTREDLLEIALGMGCGYGEDRGDLWEWIRDGQPVHGALSPEMVKAHGIVNAIPARR